MEKRSKRDIFRNRKRTIICGCMVVLAAACVLFAFLKLQGGGETVRFAEIKENQIPADISSSVIPEYRSLERALACVTDDDVYVIVTRGEKPSTGFGVSIDRMILEENDGKMNLAVYAVFDDPEKETAISQILTYPVCVVKTDLKSLPDTIELRIQY